MQQFMRCKPPSQANPAPDATAINLKIGQEYTALEDYNTAIQYFLSAYDLADNDYQKASANLLAGQAYMELGLNDQAYTRFLDSVLYYPMAYDSFTSLSILVSNGYPVDEYARGIVDYYAGSYYYAIQAFERYLATNPEHDGSVYYFKGLSHYYNGEYEQAIESYQLLIDYYPNNQFWDDAWEEIAFIYWNTPGGMLMQIQEITRLRCKLDWILLPQCPNLITHPISCTLPEEHLNTMMIWNKLPKCVGTSHQRISNL